MPISYKHKIYTTLGTPTALSGDVVSATDNAGVPAKDYTVKGKTIVWNQMLQNPNYSNTVVDTKEYVAFWVEQFTSPYYTFFKQNLQAPELVSAIFTASTSGNCRIKHNGAVKDITFYYFTSVKDHKYYICFNFTSTNPTVAGGVTFDKAQLFDLTQMFGAGNEPATPAEFRAMFPDDYYPYNVGELKSIAPTSVEASGVERFQLLDKSKYPATHTINGVTFTNNGDGTFTVNGNATNNAYIQLNTITMKLRHKYLINDGDAGVSFKSYCTYLNVNGGNVANTSSSNAINIYTANQNILCGCYIRVSSGIEVPTVVFKPQLFDLTEMFGAGNEPATVAEFWQRVPEKLYGYNPSAYKSVNIPSSKYFPDGMRSAGSAYDEINFLSQKAIKRIGIVDLGTLNWTSWGAGHFAVSDISFIKKPNDNNTKYADFRITSGKYKGQAYNQYNIDKSISIGSNDYLTISDSDYQDVKSFKQAMSGVYLVYELATPVETIITPPLQALPTYKGFTSFSAPNSLTQNGPLSVTYYAEGGTNPEKGWLTSYKRKLYMGRNIEWNQLLDKSKYPATGVFDGVTYTNNGDGTMTLDGTATAYTNYSLQSGISVIANHKYFCYYPDITKDSGALVFLYTFESDVFDRAYPASGNYIVTALKDYDKVYFQITVILGKTVSNLIAKPQMFDLTQMFGAGNEPATPEEFWTYFDHKIYPYNAGETQPLFKISRKSLWTVAPKHYTARWDKIHAAMVRLNDAASFPTNITNFAHRGSVNANYSNPFDNIYPWSGIKLCNISIDLYRNLAAGDSITKCVTAWEGDANFSYNDVNGVWRYRPEFWGKSWEDDTYRYFDVADNKVYDSSYVYYPEAIVGRWHGRTSTLTVGGKNQICLVPSVGMPAKRRSMAVLRAYAKRYGATIDSIFSIDADVLLCIVEFATMNTQNAIGNGVTSVYRQYSDLIAEDATNSNVVKVLASAASESCIPGAIFDIGTSNGGAEVGSYYIVSTQPNVRDAQYLDVTLNEAVTVTVANYWSVHGIINIADEEIGSKSGYIGTNGKCNSYYRGIVLFGNMWLYTLGAYENCKDQHIWIANSDEEADNYNALNTSVHYDTGLVLPTVAGYTKKLGMLSRLGLLSIPVFCTETGGDSSNPTGDYFYNGVYTYNTVLLRGGSARNSSIDGAFFGHWDNPASSSGWSYAARPRLKNP